MRKIICTHPYRRLSLLDVLEKRKIKIYTQEVKLPGGTYVNKSDLMEGIEEINPAYLGRVGVGTESNPLYDEIWLKEASHFVLDPGQEIGKHLHENDMEMWVFWWNNGGRRHIECSFCAPDQEHEWVNNTGCPVHVYAIKHWKKSWKA